MLVHFPDARQVSVTATSYHYMCVILHKENHIVVKHVLVLLHFFFSLQVYRSFRKRFKISIKKRMLLYFYK